VGDRWGAHEGQKVRGGFVTLCRRAQSIASGNELRIHQVLNRVLLQLLVLLTADGGREGRRQTS